MDGNKTLNLEGLNHIAFIMDGNRRWAKIAGKKSEFGHKAGKERFEEISLFLFDLGIKTLTFYSFSTENWNRTKEEVDTLLGIMRKAIKKDVKRFEDKGIAIRFIGDKSRFPKDMQDEFLAIETNSLKNRKTDQTLCIAVSYGGRDEIVRAINAMNDKNIEVTEKSIGENIDTAGLSDPELVIRTGGQKRLSNYLPWQSIYSELYFVDCLWPDFDVKELEKAVEFYHTIKRNFGR